MNLSLPWLPTLSPAQEAAEARKVENLSDWPETVMLADQIPEPHNSDDLSFFIDTGLGQLLRAMLKQSLNDIIEDRKNSHASAEVSLSSRWPTTPAGLSSIEFLMPGVSPHLVIAHIYKSPQVVLNALLIGEKTSAVESAQEPASSSVKEFSVNSSKGSDLSALPDGFAGRYSSDDFEPFPVERQV